MQRTAPFIALIALVSCGKPKIEQQCVMNGMGIGSCAFTNVGDATGAVCGLVGVVRSKARSAISGVFCSGRVEPQSTKRVPFTVPIVASMCREPGKSWTQVCLFGFRATSGDVPKKAAPKTLQEAFGVPKTKR